MPATAVGCRKCRRVVFAIDVNKDGLCCFCQPPQPEVVKKPEQKDKE